MKMNLNKFLPTGFKFVQCILDFKKKCYQVFSQRNYKHSSPANIFQITTGLAFMWTKSKSEVNDKKEQLQTLIKNADEVFENGRYEECYQLLVNCKDQDVEIRWRITRVLYNMSKESKYDKHYKKDLIFLAYQIISDEIEKYSENFAVQKWYALLLDAKSAYGGIKERIRQLENVKMHMDHAVSINPNDATTLHMLGEWCYQVSELPWHQRKIAEALFAAPPYSTYEDALEYFLKAESVHPRFYSINLLRLGNCYLKLKKEDQAKYYLRLAASYPAKSNDDHQANKEAAELLKKLK